MKYCVLIMDGAAGWPLPQRNGKTCLELASTPNLDAMAREGTVGITSTVPSGMEPSSACACMSVLGYDPVIYYRGRSAIEASARDIYPGEGEVIFRCNLVTVQEGKMSSYSCGYISTGEAHALISTLNEELGCDEVRFYPGVSYRHLCKMKNHEDALLATCTPPHDIPNREIAEFLPRGPGSKLLTDLMARSEVIFRDHPVNVTRRSRGDAPATMIWLFWASGKIPMMPRFEEVYALKAALTSGVDLLQGLAKMTRMEVLNIPGVTDGPDNDYAAQGKGALDALVSHDLVAIHVEAPDEASHAGAVDDKIDSIQKIDRDIVSRLRSWHQASLRVLIMPDHATPIEIQTHSGEPIPFMLWGSGIKSNGAKRFTEPEAKSTGMLVREGHKIMEMLIDREGECP
ncbi:MAG: cofactor-independent phosphoglycerate mutase [Dehalococcoidia bacterium]|nr:cofactor-independent phosphoglycerate mutase [Dehalococcoidia bacterium]